MDTLLRCNRCKINTPTIDYKVIDQDVTREEKSGEKSITNRKVIKGVCETCSAKKHVYDIPLLFVSWIYDVLVYVVLYLLLVLIQVYI